jgi:predicted transcriptional regulator
MSDSRKKAEKIRMQHKALRQHARDLEEQKDMNKSLQKSIESLPKVLKTRMEYEKKDGTTKVVRGFKL